MVPVVRHSLVAWTFVLPALLLISVSVLLPALMALVMSFSSTGLDVSEPLQFVGLANFERLITDPMVRRVPTDRPVSRACAAADSAPSCW